MKKKLLIIGICGFVILGLTTGCGSSNVKEKDVTKELNDLVNQCVGEKSESTHIQIIDYYMLLKKNLLENQKKQKAYLLMGSLLICYAIISML